MHDRCFELCVRVSRGGVVHGTSFNCDALTVGPYRQAAGALQFALHEDPGGRRMCFPTAFDAVQWFLSLAVACDGETLEVA